MSIRGHLADAVGFAAPTVEPADDGARAERQLNVARGWAGLTSQGRILISVEELAKGQDVRVLLAHESAHDVLLTGSVFGRQLVALSVFGLPPAPPGPTSGLAKRSLRAAVGASTGVQEGCATFLPSLSFEGEELDAYWRPVPRSYRHVAAALEWIRAMALSPAEAQRLVFAIGGFALGVRVPADRLADPRALRRFLAAPGNSPDARFTTVCAVLADADSRRVGALASTTDVEERLARDWFPGAAPYEPTLNSTTEWTADWAVIVRDLIARWSEAVPSSGSDREYLRKAAERPHLLAPIPGPAVLKALLTSTVTATGAVWDHPAVERLLPYRLVQISHNLLDGEVPGVETVDADGLALAKGQAALWLSDPERHDAAARVDEPTLREYVARSGPNTTFCVADGSYFFAAGDLMGLPLLRDRPHLVVVSQQSIMMLTRLSMGPTFAGSTTAHYTVVDGDVPGVAYFVARPGDRTYPVVIAPVPKPTATRAAEELARYPDGVRFVEQDLATFFGDDPMATAHMVRFFAQFENQPWPPTVHVVEVNRPARPSRIDLGPPPDSRHAGGDAFERLPQKAKTLLNRYGALERLGHLRSAESGYTRMTTTRDPTISAAGAIALGMLRRACGDLPGALEAFLLAGRSEDPDLFPLGLLYLGHMWVQAGNLSAAAETYYQVVRSRHPSHAPPAAWALSRLVPPDEADSLRRWVRDSGHPDVGPLAAAAQDDSR